jgi:hypothetical protein
MVEGTVLLEFIKYWLVASGVVVLPFTIVDLPSLHQQCGVAHGEKVGRAIDDSRVDVV